MTDQILKVYKKLYLKKSKKKRKTVSSTQRYILWRTLSHTCYLCNKRIPSLDAAELDHVRAVSKGGKTMKWAHTLCNRYKGDKGVTKTKKELGTYKPKKRIKRKTIKKPKSNMFAIMGPIGKQPKNRFRI